MKVLPSSGRVIGIPGSELPLYLDDAGTPSAPMNLLATSIGGGEYDLTWDAPTSEGASPIIEYNVYQNDVLLDTVAAPATNLDGVPAVGDDEFYVRAVNSEGEGPQSNTETIPGGDPTPGEGMFGSLWGEMFGRMFGRNPA